MEDRDTPATKGDITDLDQKIELLRSEVNHSYADLAEKMHDAETRLLKAFYDSPKAIRSA